MDKLLTAIRKDRQSVNVTGLRGSAPALFLARIAELQRPVACIVPSEHQANRLSQDLSLFSDRPVFYYPGYEIPPYTPLSPDSRTVTDRLATLYQMHSSSEPYILILSAEALLRRVLPKPVLANQAELVMAGEEVDQESLSRKLSAAGYDAAALVQSVGEFSIRGGIFDIFPPGFDYPIRLDFFGDTIESIRKFDPISQRSVEAIDEAVLLPASDIFFPPSPDETGKAAERFEALAEKEAWNQAESAKITDKLESRQRFPGIEFFLPLFYDELAMPLDFFAATGLICLLHPAEISKSLKLTRERIAANHLEVMAAKIPALPPDALFVPEEELKEVLQRFQQVRFEDFAHGDMAPGVHCPVACGSHELLKQNIDLNRKKSGLLAELLNPLHQWLQNGDRVLIACNSGRHARQLSELLAQHEFQVTVRGAPLKDPAGQDSEIVLYDSPLAAGFDLPEEKIHWLSETQLFGERRLKGKKPATQRGAETPVTFEELNIGDLVVHKSHGIGMYQGINNIALSGIANDFLQIAYQDDDKLYVPVDQLNAVSKYKGVSDKEPKLDKLGGKSWITKQTKVKEEVWKVAQDLLNLYAKRQLEKGHSYSEVDEWYRELEESFPFDETPGQIGAINNVIDDLTSERPMDRLVCGDVGYGKTEVAVRAAFKVIADNFQVALLVPTTVLAEQHAQTFLERFQGFPVKIECLNRFRTPAEQKKIVAGLAQGSIDLVIGTHRLLSKDVRFKRLGLLIIDEEHRFGVAHKERLKKLRTQVDVLTLTATPIPRTLQLSLLGIRDLSVISSPPEHRRSVKTFIARHDDLVIKEAVTRELQRGGQVFLVHNRVHTIPEVAGKVQSLVPEARIAVAHGQMPGKQLEEIMVRFVRREIDVLVCTTIIESGLDIPNANTIVITRADRLGLAEIYQLRGRVGRGREQAYAYLLVPSLDGLSKDAQQRLRALMDYNELGGGFKLAMSDLQIRGGGNILGISQSGNIAAVGYDLYLELLQKTVLDLKRKGVQEPGEEKPLEIEPEIHLKVSAYIPDRYIGDTDQRYIAYRRITCLETDEELSDLQEELTDRYGPLPPETRNLFAIIAIKARLRNLGITRLEQAPAAIILSFHEHTPVEPERILRLLRKFPDTMRFTPDSRFIFQCGTLEAQEQILREVQNILGLFMKDDNS